MDRNDEPNDPFAGLEDWAKDAEKRVRKQERRSRPPKPRYSGPASRPGVLNSPLRNALVVAAVAVVAAVLATAVPGLRSFLHPSSGAEAYPTDAGPSGIGVTTSQSAAPTDPFAGTPAAHYPKGAAGITLPAATKVTGFTAAQVGADLKQVRAALIAGRLDQRMLVGHQPDKFLALLSPTSRKDIQGWFRTHESTGVATWIDPAVRLDPAEPPRVSGSVTYQAVVDDNVLVLRVTTNFIWVYAFTGPEHPIAAEHDEIMWEFIPARPLVRAADRGMWVHDDRSYGDLVDCAASHRGLFAPTPPGAGDPHPNDSEDPENYLRADHSLDIPDDCGSAATPSPTVSPS